MSGAVEEKRKERKRRGQGGGCFPCSLCITSEPAMLPVKVAASPIRARGAPSPPRPHAQPLHEGLAGGSPSSRRLGALRGKSSLPAPGQMGRGQDPARRALRGDRGCRLRPCCLHLAASRGARALSKPHRVNPPRLCFRHGDFGQGSGRRNRSPLWPGAAFSHPSVPPEPP